MSMARHLVASEQKHEMVQIHELCGCKTTEENLEDIRKKCKAYITSTSYTPKNRDNFYLYLQKNSNEKNNLTPNNTPLCEKSSLRAFF